MPGPAPSGLLAKAVIRRAVLFGAGWSVLVRGDTEGLLLGTVMVPIAVHLSLRLLPVRTPIDPWRLALHVPRFVSGSIVGGLDVARRALAPSMPLKPGWLAPAVRLRDGARVLLGAELSLMPGTLCAGTHQGRLILHVLDTDAGFDRALAELEAELAALVGQEDPGPGTGRGA